MILKRDTGVESLVESVAGGAMGGDTPFMAQRRGKGNHRRASHVNLTLGRV